MNFHDLVIALIIAAVISLILALPLMRKKPKTALALMVLLPPLSVFSIFTYQAKKIPQTTDNKIVKTENTDGYETIRLRSLEENPDDVKTALELAGFYTSQEKYDKAITLLSNHNRTNPDVALQLATAYFAKGLLYAEKQEYKSALYLLRVAKTTAPENAPFLADLDIFIDQVTKKQEQDSH